MRERLPWPLVFQILGVVAAVAFVVATWQIWVLAFTALIVAAAILPAARFGARYRIPRGITVLAVYVLAAGVLALMARLLWPALTEQWTQFMDQLPRMIENVKGWFGSLQGWFGQWGFGPLGGSIPTPKADNVESIVGTLVTNTLKVTAGAVGAVFGLLVILVVAAYLVIDAEHIGGTVLSLLPPHQRRIAADLADPVMDRIGGYVRGQIVVSLCVGVVLAVGLSILGVKYALLIGALAAVLNVVPFVGSLVAAILGILSALNESATLAVLTTALFWGANVLEGKVLVPQLVGRATGLHPLAVMLVLLAGANLAGLIGALVSVPFFAALWEIVRTVHRDAVAVVHVGGPEMAPNPPALGAPGATPGAPRQPDTPGASP
ncbi:MAG: AI-2E family transporter [Candidatus Rokubacteria bacterium]|nr:AI-2E family transporter [Candidatus Rokubacteria bacterium]